MYAYQNVYATDMEASESAMSECWNTKGFKCNCILHVIEWNQNTFSSIICKYSTFRPLQGERVLSSPGHYFAGLKKRLS